MSPLSLGLTEPYESKRDTSKHEKQTSSRVCLLNNTPLLTKVLSCLDFESFTIARCTNSQFRLVSYEEWLKQTALMNDQTLRFLKISANVIDPQYVPSFLVQTYSHDRFSNTYSLHTRSSNFRVLPQSLFTKAFQERSFIDQILLNAHRYKTLDFETNDEGLPPQIKPAKHKARSNQSAFAPHYKLIEYQTIGEGLTPKALDAFFLGKSNTFPHVEEISFRMPLQNEYGFDNENFNLVWVPFRTARNTAEMEKAKQVAAGIAHACPNLRYLRIDYVVEEILKAFVANCQALTTLETSLRGPLSEDFVNEINSIPKLREIRLVIRPQMLLNPSFTKLSTLKELHIFRQYWRPKLPDLTPLTECQHLEKLGFNGKISDRKLKPILKRLPRLTSLTLTDNGAVTDSIFESTPHLQRLSLKDCTFSKRMMAKSRIDLLLNCKALECLSVESDSFQEKELNVMCRLPNLRQLTLHNSSIKDAQLLPSLMICKKLEFLKLNQSQYYKFKLTASGILQAVIEYGRLRFLDLSTLYMTTNEFDYLNQLSVRFTIELPKRSWYKNIRPPIPITFAELAVRDAYRF
ncbi:MAG: hypothetical protein H0W88_09920 [Parachlamydiaceae bacterium]|nr:hypothetical protein [Parachlamydiaceae bacterium]